MKWFREAKDDKAKKQIKPVTTPSKPKAPAKVTPYKKPKKVFEGPRSPDGYKRKLYVPKKFIMAGLDIKADYENDMSEYALRTLAEQAGDLELNIRWVSEVGSTCPDCMELTHSRWGSVQSFLSGRPFVRSGCGIYGYSHPGCRCYLRVVVGEDEGFYTIGVDSQHPKFSGGLTVEQILSKKKDTDKPVTDIDYGREIGL